VDRYKKGECPKKYCGEETRTFAHLVTKSGDGTRLDNSPVRANWTKAAANMN
jgi:hypothetical protein